MPVKRTPANSLTNTFDSGRCFCFYSNEGHVDSYSLIEKVQSKHDKLLLYTGTHGSSEAIYNSIYFKSLNLESLKRQKINFLDRKVPRCHKTAHHKVKTKPRRLCLSDHFQCFHLWLVTEKKEKKGDLYTVKN